MPIITLPDGSKRSFDKPVTVFEVAKDISSSLAKAALAGKIDDRLVDTSHVIDDDVNLQIITGKDEYGLEVIRHSTAHLLAHAVKQLYPDAQVTIGPVIENGFYYDFSYPPGFTPADLTKIEARMQQLAKKAFPVERQVIDRNKAIKLFRDMGEEYKAKIIEDIPAQEPLTLYKQDDFIDLCRGPHVPNTKYLKVFKLTHVAGAYWRGDSNNEMLQRIYGTAWVNKIDLDNYLHQLEEAEKRDHRKLAKKMHLFHLQPEAPGMVFWHPNGWTLYSTMQAYMRKKYQQYGYQEISTPQLLDKELWVKSGHQAKFSEEMFYTESENRVFSIKPMSCPCHVQIFKQGIKSYRDLPLRYGEFGVLHRNEPSGALHGLLRVRSFVQDDGHIFCTEEQITDEVGKFCEQLFKVYADFGFSDIEIKLSTRPDKRVGADEIWDIAEQSLEDALNAQQIDWQLNPGEGAFYGPKVEIALRDCLNRVWQMGTIQLDFCMPERLGATYIDEQGNKRTPAMLHRAIIGTFERFMGILLEHHAGLLPLWLAPVQIVVMNITDNQAEYAQQVVDMLQTHHIRAKIDLRNEKISYKIREHSIARVPYLVVVGDREMQAQQVSVRDHEGNDLGAQSLHEFVNTMQEQASMPE